MALPPVTLVRQLDTHRLVPSRHGPHAESVLAAIAEDDDHLQAIFGVEELVFGVPRAAVINAAFCHAHPLGGRFNGPDRGAWYAAAELATAQAEIGFHKSVQLAEIGRFEDSVTYDDYLADFSASFHDLRRGRGFRACLNPGSYVASQSLARRLLERDALGVIYPSVRHEGGTCLACFRPALVANVRRAKTYRFTWTGRPEPVITRG
jgi:RES domain-containing protein